MINFLFDGSTSDQTIHRDVTMLANAERKDEENNKDEENEKKNECVGGKKKGGVESVSDP